MVLRKNDRRKTSKPIEHERRSGSRRNTMEPTEIEKVNLEAHVDMCFSRHEGLAIRLEKIETSMEDLEDLIADKTQCIYNGMLGVGGSIIATLIGVIITIYNK